ncbi:MAG TPA: M3 family metallopeptidase [Acidobacteriaceae bacterium]|jgi:peptidyl-dipeptidase Dcp|nr:M3 family metallopeptidase [Acidobacteriaceae bacterium]
MAMLAGVVALETGGGAAGAQTASGPSNPFYAVSTLPYHAPAFDKIKETDYQPALEAGMAEQLKEVDAIANDPAPATFGNTFIPLEKSGQLFYRALYVFNAVTQANSSPELERVQEIEAPRFAAQDDAIYLNEKLFQRVSTIYKQMDKLQLDPESKRLVDVYYKKFVHEGANLAPENKTKLKKMNEELSTLENSFRSKLLAAGKEAAYSTKDKSALAGLTDAELKAAQEDAKASKVDGYAIPLQNTTQQPVLASLQNRATRQAIMQNSLMRAERGGANDTRDTIVRLAELRAEKAKLLGFPNWAAWTLEDQMAKTPEAAIKFMDDVVPAATARATTEGKDIQAVIDKQNGGFKLQPGDWEFYSEQVRKAKYDLNEDQVKPYFEMWNVLENGVFYAANQLYGITFKRRTDIPVYDPDVRVYEVFDTDGKPLALWYCDYFKRDNKSGGAWMDEFVGQSKLLGTKPVVFNVANFSKPAPGEPALLSFTDVTTMFHEFGHALHGMFANAEYPLLSGTDVPRDFVEFPSQFNEHWASYPAVFHHYAKHYKTGAEMPAELVEKIKRSEKFNQGYIVTELVAAAELDMQWHTIPAGQKIGDPDAFEKAALERKHVAMETVPPRYRSSYFLHIWSNDYSAGYYAYMWSEMLDDDAYQWFEENGGLTRANGDRFRKMVLSRGNTEDLQQLYRNWRGREPSTAAMLKDRGLVEEPGPAK